MQHRTSPEGSPGFVSELVPEYESALQELTFNSKPLINNLTIIAGENMNAAEDIVALVEKRLRHAPPNQKLPSLYLLDSIVKNIGGIYHEMFQRNIVTIFRTTYESVDEPTRASMRRLLATWSSVWPRKAQLIQDRLPPVPGGTSSSSSGSAGAPRGIHINPAYLAKLQNGSSSVGGDDRRGAGSTSSSYSSSRRSPPPPRHSVSPPRGSSSSSSYGRDHHATATRSPPRKRPRSPPPSRYGGAGGGSAHKAPRRTAPDRVSEILGHARDQDRPPYRDEPHDARPPYRSRSDAGGPPRGGYGGHRGHPRQGAGRHEDHNRDPRASSDYHHRSHQAPPPSHGDYSGGAPGGYGNAPLPQQMPPMQPQPQPQPQQPPPMPGGLGAAPGGHQAILAEAQMLMQQLEQRLQTQLTQPDVNHGEVMQQLNQLRVLQQQALQIQAQPPLQAAPPMQPMPGMAPAPIPGLGGPPNLMQGLGQGQQTRESILSLLQGALASSLQPAMAPPATFPQQGFAPAPSMMPQQPPAMPPMSAPVPGLSPPPSAHVPVLPTEDLLKNLMSLGMIGAPAGGPPPPSGMVDHPPAAGMTAPMASFPGMAGAPPPGSYAPQPTMAMPQQPAVGGYPQTMGGGGGGMAPGMPGPGAVPAFDPLHARRPDLVVDNPLVNRLYADFARQCGTCGLRFNDEQKMARHLDWHFAVNKKEKTKAKKAISRLWFSTAEEWVTGVDVVDKPVAPFFSEMAAANEETPEAPVMNVVADDTQTHCGICSEKFDQFWDNDLEEWMYRGAVKVEGTGQLFHQKCYEQALAFSQQQQQQQQEPATTTATAAAAAAASSATATSTMGTTPEATSAQLFWVKREPDGEAEGAPPQNRDLTSS